MRIKNVTRCIAKDAELDITGARLLTIAEAEALPERLRVSDYVWWLRTPIPVDDKEWCWITRNYIAVVFEEGCISYHSCDIDFYSVRPALKISNLRSSDLKIGDIFEFGEHKFEIISNHLAFCLDDLGSMAFMDDWRVQDACDYNKSDVKKYIDDWFEMSRRESKE